MPVRDGAVLSSCAFIGISYDLRYRPFRSPAPQCSPGPGRRSTVRTPKSRVGLARSPGRGTRTTPAVRIEHASRVERQMTGQRHGYRKPPGTVNAEAAGLANSAERPSAQLSGHEEQALPPICKSSACRRARAAIRGQCPAEIRALPHATAMAKPAVGLPPEPKHSSWRVWTPVTLTLTVFGLRTLTVKVRRVRPSPASTTPAWKLGGNLAASPIVAWNRRAFRFSLYTGKAVGSPTLQYNEMLLG